MPGHWKALGEEEKLRVKAGSEQMRRQLASMTNPMILGISSCLLGPNIYSIIPFLNQLIYFSWRLIILQYYSFKRPEILGVNHFVAVQSLSHV